MQGPERAEPRNLREKTVPRMHRPSRAMTYLETTHASSRCNFRAVGRRVFSLGWGSCHRTTPMTVFQTCTSQLTSLCGIPRENALVHHSALNIGAVT
jgi:hypothetical protein